MCEIPVGSMPCSSLITSQNCGRKEKKYIRFEREIKLDMYYEKDREKGERRKEEIRSMSSW